jgi:DNA-binding response OmpR family regulator
MPRLRRVLIVDDHVDTAQSLALLLGDMGHAVEYAIDGRAALQLTRDFRPEVVFLDMLLPDFDGSDLSRLLRLKAAPQELRIVAITGAGGAGARRRAMQAGCDAFVLKPLDPRRLDSLIDPA